MNSQRQWLFEAPVTSETTRDTNPYNDPEYYSDSECETEWELQEDSNVGFPLSEKEWEVAAGSISGLSSAEQKALRITSTFETGRPLSFGGLTGNFDRMGVSFGLMQWNIGSGSLQPLLWEFAQRYPKNFDAVFGPDASQLRQMLEQFHKARNNSSEQKRIIAEQMRFVSSINDRRCDPGNKSTHKFCKLVEPWASYFRRLEADSAFQQIQLRQVRKSMNRAIEYARHFRLRSERGLVLMFDIVTGSGGAWLTKKSRATLIEQARATLQQNQGRSLTERDVLTVIANVVADTALPQWREKVRVRKMVIVNGYGKVHGRNFDLARDFGLTDQPWEIASGTAQPKVPVMPATSITPAKNIKSQAQGPYPNVNTQLPKSGLGFCSYGDQSRKFGLHETIQALVAIGAAWNKANPNYPRIGIGEISKSGGGKISDHVSHQMGVDVDFFAMRNDKKEQRALAIDPRSFKNSTPKDSKQYCAWLQNQRLGVDFKYCPNYSQRLTQELVNIIRANGILRVKYIFFNDPAIKGVTCWPNHNNHLHVRFYPPSKTASTKELESQSHWLFEIPFTAETT